MNAFQEVIEQIKKADQFGLSEECLEFHHEYRPVFAVYVGPELWKDLVAEFNQRGSKVMEEITEQYLSLAMPDGRYVRVKENPEAKPRGICCYA